MSSNAWRNAAAAAALGLLVWTSAEPAHAERERRSRDIVPDFLKPQQQQQDSSSRSRSTGSSSKAAAEKSKAEAAAKAAQAAKAAPGGTPGAPGAAPAGATAAAAAAAARGKTTVSAGRPQPGKPGGAPGKSAAGASSAASSGQAEITKSMAESVRPMRVDYDAEEMAQKPGVIILNARRNAVSKDRPFTARNRPSDLVRPL